MSEAPSRLGLGTVVRSYPIPVVAGIGLALGSVFTWGFGNADLGGNVWLLTLAVGGIPIVIRTAIGMLRRRFAADVIAMLAIAAALIFDEGFAGTVIVLMQSGGEALEDYGFGRASSALHALMARAPRNATRLADGSTTVISVDEVKPGDVLLVKTGELVPVDGSVLSPEAEVDESALTGEPLPRHKDEGESLMSGSVNTGGAIEMKATRASGESQYSKIVRLVEEAQKEKPHIERLADRYAVWFTPLTLAVATIGVFVTSDLHTLLSVLVVATPCPLILATPIAVISGVNRAAADGIIVKSGAALEQVASTKVMVFDKTGTLTFGIPAVESVTTLGDLGQDEVLLRAAAVEQMSSHPVATSLAAMGREKFGNLPAPENFRESPSRGVEGDVNGTHVVVGLKKFCEERTGVSFPADRDMRLNDFAAHGRLVTFVAVDGKPSGLIAFTDQVRPGVQYMVGRLRDLGVKEIVMLTGDNRENAEVVARQTGITSYEADLLPGEKVEKVTMLRKSFGTTGMVGDGINDAPALAAATIGIAMGAKGTGISAEAADMVLLVDDVTRVPEAMVTGRRMDSVARQGINFGLGASLVLMGIATFGFIEPALGAMLQEVIDVSVILNALRVR